MVATGVRALPGGASGERFYFRVDSTPPAGERGGHLAGDGWLTLRLGGSDERVIETGEMRLLGRHNVANALAAAIAARLYGAPIDAIAAGLRSFRALEHRMEPVAERDGVHWHD